MTVPALLVFANGPVAVTGDNLNTFVQTAQNAAQVRTISGKSGMAIMLQGISTPGDGNGGFFYWNGSSTASDDNLDVLVPNGTAPGAWLRLTMKVTQ